MIPGDINGDGLWVVTAAQAAELPDGAAIEPYLDATGRRVERPPSGLLKQEGGTWVSKDPLAGGLEDGVTYEVRIPRRYQMYLAAQDRGYTSQEEFEAALRRGRTQATGGGGTIGAAVASCSHGGELGVRTYTRAAS